MADPVDVARLNRRAPWPSSRKRCSAATAPPAALRRQADDAALMRVGESEFDAAARFLSDYREGLGMKNGPFIGDNVAGAGAPEK